MLIKYLGKNNKCYVQNWRFKFDLEVWILKDNNMFNLFGNGILRPLLFKSHLAEWQFGLLHRHKKTLNTFLSFLRSLHPNTTFSFETENNSTIHYLDLTVTNRHNKIKFNVFKKSTFTDITTPNSIQSAIT